MRQTQETSQVKPLAAAATVKVDAAARRVASVLRGAGRAVPPLAPGDDSPAMNRMSVPLLRPRSGRHRARGRLDSALQVAWVAAHAPALALLWMAVDARPAASLPVMPVAESPDTPLAEAP